MRNFRVWHEKGGYIGVVAKNRMDAIEKYYEALESTIGHHLKICVCFGEPKPIDRSKVVRPIRVEEIIEKGSYII